MAVIAVTGLKGGTGKSTLTANLAYEFSVMGHSVAIFDTDPQKSLWTWAHFGDGFLSRSIQTLDPRKTWRFKEEILEAPESRVLIDTPPGFVDPAPAASRVADLVLLPCGPSPLDLYAAKEALEMLNRECADRKPLFRFVPSRIFPRTNLSKELASSLEALGEKVLPAIGHRVGIAAASFKGLTIGELQPRSLARQEFRTLAKSIEKLLK